MTHFFHSHGVAKVGDQALVPLVDEASGADFKRKIGAFESITFNCVGQVAVSLCFPLQGNIPHITRTLQ